MKKIIAISFAGVICALFGARTAEAYEEDVHVGLTEWLALKAGFTQRQAALLALGDVAYDHSPFSAPTLVIHYACGGKSEPTASKLVQKNHFPGDGPVPGPAKDRHVEPGSFEARRQSLNQIEHPSANIETSIQEFGGGLHVLQDSWSHRGIPDSPLPLVCDRNFSWGHPADRGGWKRHRADLTKAFPKDAIAMAQATFNQICEYSNKVLKNSCQQNSFKLLAPEVQTFATAETKTQKREWFLRHGIQGTDFLDDTSLATGGRFQLFASKKRPVRSNLKAMDKSEEAQFMVNFFSNWMRNADLSGVVKEQIAPDGFRVGIGSEESENIKPDEIYTMLMLWRSRDHGAVAEALHESRGLALAGKIDNLKELTAPYESVEDALLPLGRDGQPIVVTTIEDRGEPLVVAVVRFSQAPHDSIFVFARKLNGRLAVVGMTAAVEH